VWCAASSKTYFFFFGLSFFFLPNERILLSLIFTRADLYVDRASNSTMMVYDVMAVIRSTDHLFLTLEQGRDYIAYLIVQTNQDALQEIQEN
jgi:hypothetical protein